MTNARPSIHARTGAGRAAAALLCGALLCAPYAATSASADSGAVVHPQLWPAAHSRGLVDPAVEARISELLAQMSVEEKVGQVVQADISSIQPEDLRRFPLGSVLAGGNSGVHGDERAPPAAWARLAQEFRAVSLEARPGHVPIPVIFGIDAVHGHNNIVGAVVFPHNIGLGAAHDAELVRRVGAATAEEVAATGIDWTFAPTLAVPQDVRWGRIYEGYSQDPALVRQYAGAAIEGLQGPAELGDKLQAGHIAATAKHFLGDGGTHDGVDTGDTLASEADLIRLHAQGYPPAIDAGVLTVMASYSSWQGVKMHGNRELLTTVLKQRMGFDGFVVGDWNGHAHVPGCTASRCPQAFNAGIDMFMAPKAWKDLYANTVAEVRSGEIPAARLDDAVRRILRVKFRLGAFEAARPYAGRVELIGSAAHRALAREAVRKSLVLLKNDGVLPIRAGARVLVTGPGAQSIGMQCGGWTITWQGSETSNADFPNGQSIQDGIRSALEAGGGSIVEPGADSGAMLLLPQRPDVAIVVFGESPYSEYLGDVNTVLYNPREPLTVLQQLHRLGIPVVSVFLSGRPLWVNPELAASDAFVAAWLPGTEGGGIADLLIGDAAGHPRSDFSGRLSFPWPGSAAPDSILTSDASRPPLYPIGYGLHYGKDAAH